MTATVDDLMSAATRRSVDAALSGPTLVEVKSWPASVGIPPACDAIGISRSWGYQLAAQDAFPCRTVKIRGRTRVLTASLISLLETGQL